MKTLCILLTFLVSVNLGSARELLAVFLDQPEDLPTPLYLFDGTQSYELEVAGPYFSLPVVLPKGDLRLVLSERELEEGAEISPDMVKFVLPGSWSRVYLVCLPTNKVGEGSLPINVTPVNASDGELPLGTTLLMNLSRAEIYGNFGKLRVAVKPGETKSFAAPIREFGSYPVRINCILPGEAESQPLMVSNWLHDPDVKQLVFVTPRATSKFPAFRAVTDKPDVSR